MRRLIGVVVSLSCVSLACAQTAREWISWEEGGGPAAREHATVLIDHERDRAVFYAGSGYRPQMSPLSDAWAVSLETGEWSEMELVGDVPEGGGSKRAAAAGGGAYLLWGGYGEGFVVNNRLVRARMVDGVVEFETVRQRNAPEPRALHGFVYDAARGRYLMFGGVSQRAMYDDVWSMRLEDGVAVWERLEVERGPGERYGFACAMDGAGDRMIVYSGAVPGQGLVCAQDAWALDFSKETPAWERLTGEDATPTGRRNPLWAFDAGSRRLIVTGGTADGRSAEGDLVALDLSGESARWVGLDAGDVEIRASGMGFFDAARGSAVFGMGNNARGVCLDLYRVE